MIESNLFTYNRQRMFSILLYIQVVNTLRYISLSTTFLEQPHNTYMFF